MSSAMDKDERSRARISVAARTCSLILLATLGCEHFPEELEKEEVLSTFGELSRRDASQSSLSRNPEETVALYLDSSMSMRGFIAESQSEYNQVIESLLDNVVAGRYELETYRFAENILPQSIDISAVHDGTFYAGTRSSFSKLCEHIEVTRRDGRVSIVLSDLVQSESVQDNRTLARSFRRLVDAGFKVRLLAFRSSFHGRYWVESGSERGRVLDVDFDARVDDESRPFYLIVLAQSTGELSQAVERLFRDELKPEVSYAPSSPEIKVKADGVDVQTVEDDPASVWSEYSFPEVDTRDGFGSRVWARVLPAPRSRFELEKLKVALTLSAESRAEAFRIRRGEKVDVELSTSHCVGGECGNAERLKGEVEVKLLKATEPKIELSFNVRQPERMSWDVYRMQLRPGGSNLDVPAWVSDWNTDDDRAASALNRTLNLDLFVEVLKVSAAEKTPFVDLFLQVGRGNK